jgi:gas vesicle protein
MAGQLHNQIGGLMTDYRSSLFFYGFGLGVVGALLLAPKSGVQTRTAIVDKTKEGQEFLKRQSSQIRDAVTGTIERGRKAAGRTVQGIADALDAEKSSFAGNRRPV